MTQWQLGQGPWLEADGILANWLAKHQAHAVLVRPDHHVAWRADSLTDNPLADLKRVLKSILGR